MSNQKYYTRQEAEVFLEKRLQEHAKLLRKELQKTKEKELYSA